MTEDGWLQASPLLAAVGNHLWQSTIVAGAGALLTLALRRNRAEARYALWLAASVKFLVPFAALVALGSQFGWRTTSPIVQPELAVVIDAIGQPFSGQDVRATATALADEAVGVSSSMPRFLLTMWFAGFASIVLTWWTRWRRVAAAVRGGVQPHGGREVALLRRLECASGIGTPIRFVLSDTSLEPAVFGIRTPVLLWPRRISECLNDDHVEAILAHELSHVRRRDNLVSVVHMFVQAAFWFHPMVWWVGARLINERERACDEAVIESGRAPQVYAESILKTCRFAVESPLACVAGVTGADLTKRIEWIMSRRQAEVLNRWRRLLMATCAAVAVVAPLAVGVLSATRLPAQAPPATTDSPTFEVASVKRNTSDHARMQIGIQPGGRYTATNASARQLIQNAYGLQPFQITGAPAWLADRFDVVAKGEPGGQPGPGSLFAIQQGPSRQQLMLRALLADRFKLKARIESREMPIYTLALARGDGRLGPQLRKAAIDCAAAAEVRGRGPAPAIEPFAPHVVRCGMRIGPGNVSAGGVVLPQFANTLAIWVSRSVQDRTGLAGNFDIDLQWTPDRILAFGPGGPPPDSPPVDPTGPSIFSAIQDQLGLKLESTRGPVDILVIDHVERPTQD